MIRVFPICNLKHLAFVVRLMACAKSIELTYHSASYSPIGKCACLIRALRASCCPILNGIDLLL